MLRKVLAALFAALLLSAFVGCSSDDGGSEESTSESESATEDKAAEDEEAADEEAADDEKAEPEARKLVEQLEESGGFGELDEDIALCTAEAALEDEVLAEMLMADEEIDPSSPEFITLVEIIVGCDGRPYLEEAFLEGAGSEATAEQSACLEELLASYSDDEFVQLMADLAAEDEAAIGELATCMM